METPSKSFPLKPKSAEGVTLLGLGINVGLTSLKIGLGLALGSTALFADGVHSLSDLATDFITLSGIRMAKRPPDETHAYGHGKFETIAGALVALALVGVGLFIVWEAVAALRKGALPRLGWVVALAAALSVLLKEWLYRLTVKLGRELRSAALEANAWHHRSDALSSLPVFVGGICANFGIARVDGAAALVVAALIGWAAFDILRRALHELAEGAFSPTDRDKVIAAIEGVDGGKKLAQIAHALFRASGVCGRAYPGGSGAFRGGFARHRFAGGEGRAGGVGGRSFRGGAHRAGNRRRGVTPSP